MKTIKFSFCICIFILLLAGCGNEYQQLSEENVESEISDYINKLDNSNQKEYQVFDSEDGKEIVVISSGEPSKKIKLAEVHMTSLDTVITVEESINQEDQPYIIVELSDIKGAFYVFDRTETEINGSGYYE
jgi:hypothetical protein